MSKDFNRTESRILSALSRLHEFVLNPLLQGDSGSAPEASQNALSTNYGMSEDDSRSNLHSEAKVSQSQTTQVFGPEDAYYMVTRVQEDIPHISFLSSSGKQK